MSIFYQKNAKKAIFKLDFYGKKGNIKKFYSKKQKIYLTS